jgi:amino acid transporter
MILLTIIVATLLIGIALLVFQDFFWKKMSLDTETAGAALTVIGAIALAISLLVIAVNYGSADITISENQQVYESLVYQYENQIYDNDNDIGLRDLMVDIQNWNSDLAVQQAKQKNIWIGIYVPNIYDQFEFIELAAG